MKLRFSRKQLCIPYAVFLLFFVILPMLIIVFYAFTEIVYESGQAAGIRFTLSNFTDFFTNETNLTNLLRSILIALCTTIICLLLAYPVAYILAKTGIKKSYVLLLLFIVPMWVNFVLRINALRELLDCIGILNKSMGWNYFNTILGMVYDFFPFMVLPLYTTLEKIDDSYLEAAQDLGAGKAQCFCKVTLPLSYPGIMSGITMVFLPSMTNYVISQSVGGSLVTIIGDLIDMSFLNDQWNSGSAIALILLVVMFLSTWLTGGFKDDSNSATRGASL